jgi:AraC-like DNA-binding protein
MFYEAKSKFLINVKVYCRNQFIKIKWLCNKCRSPCCPGNLLTDFEQNHTIREILDKVHLPLRTFNRKFKETIGVNPIEYQRIARFRHSLNNKLFAKGFKKLTDIGYESNFYDQSYFIKIYKKLTGSNPKSFFSHIEKLAEDRLIFRFING